MRQTLDGVERSVRLEPGRAASRSRLQARRGRSRLRRSAADVHAVILEDVVGHEDDGHRARELRDLLLPADALLQRRERQRPLVAKGEDLAVEHRAVGQARRRRGDLGKAVRDQLLAARPQVHDAAALDELRADAVPLPFDQPLRGSPRRLDRILERRREEERVRPRRSSSVRSCEGAPTYHSAYGVQSPISRAAIVGGGRPAACASARTTSVCETPTRSSPVSSLSRMKRCRRSSVAPPARDALLLRRRRRVARSGQDPILDPARERQVFRRRRRRQLIEHERRGLGAVADDRVALLEQPVLRGPSPPASSRGSTRRAPAA